MIPNFFVIGAPKCGTTALTEYLRWHPDIFVSWPKEPHFLATDLPKLWRYDINTRERYLALFPEHNEDYLAVGEGSVWYLYSSEAAKNILQLNPMSKVIVLLRNPIEVTYALHSQYLYSFQEDVEDFEKAWQLSGLRRERMHIPEQATIEVELLDYSHVVLFGEQLERLYSVFPPAQVKVILFEDFVSSTRTVYEDVLSYLNVPLDGREDFPRINVNKQHKIRWLGKITDSPHLPSMFYRLFRQLKESANIDIRWFTRILRRINADKQPRPPLHSEFRAELAGYFRNDVNKLSEIIDRDLSHWLEVQSSSPDIHNEHST